MGVDGTPRPSEDRIAVLEHAVVLLDGATNLIPGRRSGGWYAERLVTALAGVLRERPSAELTTLLAEAIDEVARRHGLEPGHSPSSTVAMLRWSEFTVDALVLADSPVVLRTGDGVRVLADDRIHRLPRSGGGYRSRLAAGEGFGAEHAAALREGAEATEKLRNVDGGFWVAEANPDAAARAVTGSWPRAEVSAALLASDGVSCAVDDYGLFGWPEVFERINTDGCAALLDRIEEAELADPQGLRWPRPKRSDDKAIAYVDLVP